MRQFFLLFSIIFSLTSTAWAHDMAVVTMAIGDKYQEAVSIGIDAQRAYCKKHNYPHYYLDHSLDPDRHFPWHKILFLLDIMENTDHEWLYWMDADSLVMNTGVRLDDLIDDNYDIIITSDIRELCTGQFFIRNTPEMQALLQRVYNWPGYATALFWEQTAFVEIYQKDLDIQKRTKVLPQRLFNSFLYQAIPEKNGFRPILNHPHAYFPGDFLVHFCAVRSLEKLRSLFETYSMRVCKDAREMPLDVYLGIYGFALSPKHSQHNEGYMTEAQKDQFTRRLHGESSKIQSVLEIGLNGGHSARHFFDCCPNLKRFASFDINTHPYTKPAVEYFQRFYGDNFTFVEGDSTHTVPLYAHQNPESCFDLIYIDGDMYNEGYLHDILNCRALAHADTVLWIDDYADAIVQNTVDALASQGIIEIINSHYSHDLIGGTRCWVEARYNFTENN